MRLLTFARQGRQRLGAELPEGVLDLTAAHTARLTGALDGQEPTPAEATALRAVAEAALPPDMGRFLALGELALAQAEATLAECRARLADGQPLRGLHGEVLLHSHSEVRRLAPVPRPGKILCIGLNYREHAAETHGVPPSRPLLFSKFPSCVIGPGEAIRLPAIARKVDYEAELAVVIGRSGRRIPRESALDYVAGYTLCNDVSARDLQLGDGQWQRGKSLDTFAPLGPVLVTRDEIPDPARLRLRCYVNGELRQDASVGEMIFSVAELVAFLSEAITLEPGDVIATGTPAGVGMAREPSVYLRAGDRVVVESEGIGRLENPVCADAPDEMP